MRSKTHEEYENQLLDIEADLYPAERYVTAKTKILHECLQGHVISIAPDTILSQRVGCGLCKNVHRKKTDEEYWSDLEYKRIDYRPLELYEGTNTPILHKCYSCGESWKVKPGHILAGHGCPKCLRKGPANNRPCILYYIKIENKYFKIGITGNSVFTRFSKDRDKKIDIIFEKQFDTGLEAKLEEERILLEYNKYLVYVPRLLESKGNTEIFHTNILELDNAMQTYFCEQTANT